MTKQERILILVLALLNFTHILDFMIMMPLGNYLMPYFKIGSSEFSVLVSAYALSAGFSSFFSAFFVNGFDRKKILLVAYLGFLIGTLGCGLAPSFVTLLISRIVAGLFGGLLGAQVISIVSDIIPFERRGRAMGQLMGAFAVASIVGVPFSLYMANLFSWHAPFLIIAILGLVVVPLIYKFVPFLTGHINSQKVDLRKTLGDIFKNSEYVKALLFSGLMMMGHFLIIPFINPFLEYNKGIPKTMTPLVYLFGGISALIFSNVVGILSDKYGKWLFYKICVIISIPLILFVTNIPSSNIVLILFIFSLWFAAATGRGVTSQALVSNVVSQEIRGSFQSFNSFMQQIGTGLASIIAGLVVHSNADLSLENYHLIGYLSIIILTSTILIGKSIFGDSNPKTKG
jgi:MFS transporter, DHA1 family, inner membrane transport protein